MSKLLIPLLAAISLPTATNAETYYLLGSSGRQKTFNIPMDSLEDCEKAGKRFLDRDQWKYNGGEGLNLA